MAKTEYEKQLEERLSKMMVIALLQVEYVMEKEYVLEEYQKSYKLLTQGINDVGG